MIQAFTKLKIAVFAPTPKAWRAGATSTGGPCCNDTDVRPKSFWKLDQVSRPFEGAEMLDRRRGACATMPGC